ncbi:MAG: AAA family ATPase [Candidatus Hodarchaeales archaeon]
MAQIYDAILLGKVNPFRSTSVGDPWQAEVIDVPEYNEKATRVVLETLDEVRSTGRSGMCMILGDAGVGKTHVLARLRRIAEENRYLFVSVRPLGDLTRIYGHILQELMISLRKKDASEEFSPLEHFIGDVISRALSDGLPENPTAQRLAASFDQDPMKIFTYKPERFYSSTLRKMAINYLASSAPDIDIQFLEVLFHVLNPTMRPTAFKWLSGIEVSQKDLDRLEVPHSINSENRALSIIQTIASLAQKPILLSFDQLESIYIRFKRDDGIQLLFDSLTNLYNQCRHLLVLAMCQTLVWNESITKEVPEYSRQRIDYITKLEPLSPSNAVALVKARFDVMFLDSGVIPPYATYPFRDDYIAKVAATTDGNPRLFLRQLRDRINEFKDKGQIIELTADEASSDVQKEAVAGVPPITPEEIISSSTTSLSDESAQALMSLTSEEREALADLFPDMEEPPIEQISVSSRTENALEALEEIPSQQPEKSAPTEIINFLEAKWAKYAQEYEMEIFAFPHPVRRDFLKGVLYEILNSAIEKKRPIYGLNILNVRIDRNLVEKDTKGLDLVFTYQTPRGPTSVGIEINNSEHGSTVFQSLRRLKKLVRGNIRFAFILRDEELSLQRTASKSLDLAESLTDYGGLYYIDFLSNQALLATKKLLDLASAGDLVIGTQTVSRNQALSFVFEECLNRISIFQTIFNHLQSSQEPTQKLGSYASESSEAVEAIVTILKFNPSMTIDRLCMLLNRNETDLNPILKMLSIRGLISFDGKNISLL